MIIQCRFDYVNSIKTITYSRYTDMPLFSPFEYTSFLVAIISCLHHHKVNRIFAA